MWQRIKRAWRVLITPPLTDAERQEAGGMMEDLARVGALEGLVEEWLDNCPNDARELITMINEED